MSDPNVLPSAFAPAGVSNAPAVDPLDDPNALPTAFAAGGRRSAADVFARHAAAGKTLEQTNKTLAEEGHAPLDARGALDYKLAAARQKSLAHADPLTGGQVGTLEAFGQYYQPFRNFIRLTPFDGRTVTAGEYDKSQKAFAAGTATDDDIGRITDYERTLRAFESVEKAGVRGKTVTAFGHVSQIGAEMVVGGAMAGRAPILGRTFATRQAVVTAASPSMYVPMAQSINLREGRAPGDWRGYPTAVMHGYLTTIALGHVTGGMKGKGLGTALGKGLIGAVEINGLEDATQIMDRLLPKAYAVGSRGGAGTRLVTGLATGAAHERDEAAEEVAAQILSFAGLAYAHAKGDAASEYLDRRRLGTGAPGPATVADSVVADARRLKDTLAERGIDHDGFMDVISDVHGAVKEVLRDPYVTREGAKARMPKTDPVVKEYVERLIDRVVPDKPYGRMYDELIADLPAVGDLTDPNSIFRDDPAFRARVDKSVADRAENKRRTAAGEPIVEPPPSTVPFQRPAPAHDPSSLASLGGPARPGAVPRWQMEPPPATVAAPEPSGTGKVEAGPQKPPEAPGSPPVDSAENAAVPATGAEIGPPANPPEPGGPFSPEGLDAAAAKLAKPLGDAKSPAGSKAPSRAEVEDQIGHIGAETVAAAHQSGKQADVEAAVALAEKYAGRGLTPVEVELLGQSFQAAEAELARPVADRLADAIKQSGLTPANQELFARTTAEALKDLTPEERQRLSQGLVKARYFNTPRDAAVACVENAVLLARRLGRPARDVAQLEAELALAKAGKLPVGGGVTPDGHLFVDGEFMGFSAKEVQAHEFGHLLDGTGPKQYELSSSEEWAGPGGAWEEIRRNGVGEGWHYARLNEQEGLAEFYRYLRGVDGALFDKAARFPIAAKFFQDRNLWPPETSAVGTGIPPKMRALFDETLSVSNKDVGSIDVLKEPARQPLPAAPLDPGPRKSIRDAVKSRGATGANKPAPDDAAVADMLRSSWESMSRDERATDLERPDGVYAAAKARGVDLGKSRAATVEESMSASRGRAEVPPFIAEVLDSAKLTSQQRFVVESRLRGVSLAETGEAGGAAGDAVTRERVRQVEKQAVEKLSGVLLERLLAIDPDVYEIAKAELGEGTKAVSVEKMIRALRQFDALSVAEAMKGRGEVETTVVSGRAGKRTILGGRQKDGDYGYSAMGVKRVATVADVEKLAAGEKDEVVKDYLETALFNADGSVSGLVEQLGVMAERPDTPPATLAVLRATLLRLGAVEVGPAVGARTGWDPADHLPAAGAAFTGDPVRVVARPIEFGGNRVAKGVVEPVATVAGEPDYTIPEDYYSAFGDLSKVREKIRSAVSETGWFGKPVRRWLRSTGKLPTYLGKLKAEAEAADRVAAQEVREFDKDVKPFARSATPEQTDLMNRALRSEEAARAELLATVATAPVVPVLERARETIKTYSRALGAEGVIDSPLVFALDKNAEIYLTRQYQVFDDTAWAEKVDPKVVNRAAVWMESYIRTEEGRQPLPGEVAARVRALLSPQEAKSAARDVLKNRGELPEELRELWGEYKDPAVNFANTVGKQAYLLNSRRMFTKMLAAGKGVHFFEASELPAFEAKFPGVKPAKIDLSGSTAEGGLAKNPLDGKYTTPEVLDGLKEMATPKELSGMMRVYMGLLAATKYAKTVLSPAAHAVNTIGNGGIAVRNGDWNFADLPAVYRVLRDDSPAGRDYWRKLIRLDVVNNSVDAGEFRDVMKEVVSLPGTAGEGIARTFASRAKEALAKGADAVERLYQLEDAVWKVMSFRRNSADYAKARPDWTAEQVDAHAAEVVRNTWPTYPLVAPAVKALRRNPLLGPFVSFSAEVARTTYHNVRLGLAEIKDPRTRSIGVKRLAGTAIAGTLGLALATATGLYFNVTKDDEADMRRGLPEWEKNANLLHLGRDANGGRRYVALSRYDPHSYLGESVAAMFSTDDPEQAARSAGDAAAKPFLAEELLTRQLLDVARNKTETRGPVYNPQAPLFAGTLGLDGKVATVADHVADAFKPGVYSSGRRVYTAAVGNKTDAGQTRDLATELAAAGGVRVNVYSPAAAVSYNAVRYRKAENDATALLTTQLRSKGDVGPDDVAAAGARMEDARRRVWDEMRADVLAAQRLGVDRTEVAKQLRSAGVAADEVLSLLSGVYRPKRIDPRDFTPDQRKRIQPGGRVATVAG